MKARFLLVKALVVFVVVLVLGAAGRAHAEDKEALLLEAAKAWENADLSKAANLYDKALKEGALFPADVLVAYARIGTVRAAMNKRNAALSAFRVAAALDPTFELPSEAGPKAEAIYEKARQDAKRQGGKLEVSAEVPTQSAQGAEFVVVAHIAEAFVPLIVEVGITVQDPSISTSTVKPWTDEKQADTKVEFVVPGKVVMAGANLLVRIDALDSHGNRWASTQARVKVEGQPKGYGAVDPDDPFFDDDGKKKKKDDDDPGGFWSSSWPWVIGGAIIVGGTATYFMSRPGDEVTVGSPSWQ